MRILQVTNGYPPRAFGGVETHTQRLARALVERGHELQIFTRHSDPEGADGDFVDEESAGISVRSVVNDARGGSFRDHFLSAGVESAFLGAITQNKPDIIHFQHLIGLSASLPLLAREQRIRCVATVHEYWYVCQRTMLQKADLTPCAGPAGEDCVACFLGKHASRREMLRDAGLKDDSGVVARLRARVWAAARAGRSPSVARERFATLHKAIGAYEKITTPSQFVIDELDRQGMRLDPLRTRPIALGIPSPNRLAQPARTTPVHQDDPLRLVFIGHLLPHKGPHTLLEALRLIPRLPLKLDLHGTRWPNHPYEKTLQPLLDSEPRATAHGRFEDEELAEILAQADLLVVPSTCAESFGLATREALLAGRPVLTTDRGALPESIRNGEEGLVIPAENPRSMADALQQIAQQEGLLSKLSVGAQRAHVRSMEEYAAEIEEFLYN